MPLDVSHDNLDLSWHRSHLDSHPQPHDGNETIAISAFFLSTLQTSLKRKRIVKEMWESGAGTIVRRVILSIFLPLILVHRFYWITAIRPASKALPRPENFCWTLARRKWGMTRTRSLGHTFWHRYASLSHKICSCFRVDDDLVSP